MNRAERRQQLHERARRKLRKDVKRRRKVRADAWKRLAADLKNMALRAKKQAVHPKAKISTWKAALKKLKR